MREVYTYLGACVIRGKTIGFRDEGDNENGKQSIEIPGSVVIRKAMILE
jgi:hypothetical protein